MSLADVEVREVRNLVFRFNELLKKKDNPGYQVKQWDYLFEVDGSVLYPEINKMYKELGENLTELFMDYLENKNRIKQPEKKKKKIVKSRVM